MGPEPSDRRAAYAAWLTVCVVWGTGYLAYRIAVRDTPPFLFAGLRILAAGLILVGWAAANRTPVPSRRDLGVLALVGVLTEGICNAVLAWSAQWISSGLLGVLIATTTFWMVGIEATLRGGERLNARSVSGLALGFAGVVWLAAPEMASGPRGSFLAILLIQLVSVSFAAGSILARRRAVQVSATTAAGYQMVSAGGSITIVGLLAGEAGRFTLEGKSLVAFLYLLFVGSIVGFSAYIFALRTLPVSVVGLHRFVNPVVALFLGWAVLGERLTLQQGAAVALIFAGVLLVMIRRKME